MKRREILVCLCICFFTIFAFNANALTYYSRTNNGLWTTNSTWSTVTYGNATNTGTYPGAGDNVYIGDGYTIRLNTTSTIANLYVGQGSSGKLEYFNLASYSLTVSGNLNIYAGATLNYPSNSTFTHQLMVGGNISNAGTLDLYFDSNDLVNLTLNGATNGTLSGSGVYDLNTVTLGKTVSTASVDVQSNEFENAIRTLALTIGTWIHNNVGNYNFTTTAPGDYTIGQNVFVKVQNGTVNFSPAGTILYLQGGLVVNGGTATVGDNTGTGGIRTDQASSVVPYLEVSSGTLNVPGSISFKTGSFSEPFSFRMTGGDILLNYGTTGVASEVFYITDLTASTFYMSGGTITLQKRNTTGSTVIDCSIPGNNGTITTTGGTIRFGNASTPNNTNFNIKPFASATYPVLRVSGATSSNNKLQSSNGVTSNYRILGLQIDAGTTFDIQSISGSAGNSRTVRIVGTVDGTNAWINNGTFTYRSSVVSFEGTTMQYISGTTRTYYYYFTINNAAHVTLSQPIVIENYLTLTLGKIYSSYTNLITSGVAGNTSIGSATSYVVGPYNQAYKQTGAAAGYFPIGNNTNWRPMVLTPSHIVADSVNYIAEMINSPAAALPYALPGTLSAVSNVRYWTITNTKTSVFNNATIRLYYGADDGVTDRLNLRVAQAISPNWVDRGGTGTANGSGNILSTSFNAWGSIYTLANSTGGANALPIELTQFTATPQDNVVNLLWQTASEINNDFFTIERSTDSEHYTAISQTEGAGNSSGILNYYSVDEQPLKGISYYRLKQTDFDGTTSYSAPVAVLFKSNRVFTVYPNPSNGNELNIAYKENDVDQVTVNIKNVEGVSLYERKFDLSEMHNLIKIEKPPLSSGLYTLSLNNGIENVTEKLIISK